jgi:hypothetical protein
VVLGAGTVALLLLFVLTAVDVEVDVVFEVEVEVEVEVVFDVVSLEVVVVFTAGITTAGAPTPEGAAIVVGIDGLPASVEHGDSGPSSMNST